MKLIRIHCHSDQDERIAACRVEIHPDQLAIYRELGIIELKEETIDIEQLRRLHKILRLKRNCGVNTVGASIIVDLLERIEKLQDEIEVLRRK